MHHHGFLPDEDKREWSAWRGLIRSDTARSASIPAIHESDAVLIERSRTSVDEDRVHPCGLSPPQDSGSRLDVGRQRSLFVNRWKIPDSASLNPVCQVSHLN